MRSKDSRNWSSSPVLRTNSVLQESIRAVAAAGAKSPPLRRVCRASLALRLRLRFPSRPKVLTYRGSRRRARPVRSPSTRFTWPSRDQHLRPSPPVRRVPLNWPLFASTAARRRSARCPIRRCRLRTLTRQPNQPSSSALLPVTRRDTDRLLKSGGSKVNCV